MDIKSFFINIIEQFLAGQLNRKTVSETIANELPFDVIEGDSSNLMTNCEWALRHINEPEYWTPKNELKYYLACLKGEKEFSPIERDKTILD